VGVAVTGSVHHVVSTGENRIRVFDDAAAPCPAVNFGPGSGIHPAGPDRRRPKVKLKGLPKRCARRNFTLKIHASDDIQLRRFVLLVNHRRVVRILIELRVVDTAGKKSRVRRSFRICG
jgi:hypothetical protein